MERKYLMVRAMSSQQEHFDEFFKNGVVAIGWKNVKFIEFEKKETLREKVKEVYFPQKNGPKVGMKLNECMRFKGIEKGDYIIIPYYSGIALAVAQGEEWYSESADKLDLCNQHRVEYIRKNGDILSVSRKCLSEGLQRRLRVPGVTVADLTQFSDEIDKLFAKPEEYSYSNETKKHVDEMQEKFCKDLLFNIQNGKTNLRTGGEGMEHLIKELFECQGYDARVLKKTQFPSGIDADIKAWRDDDFLSTKIYAQVKHHTGYSSRYGIDQIIKAVEHEEEKNGENYIGIFVTSADVSESDKEYAEEHNIKVIDGRQLVKMILTNLGRLKRETVIALGIVPVPSVFELKET